MLERIYSREIHMVQVVDFLEMPELMRDGLFAKMVIEHRDDTGVAVFTSRARGRLFDTRGPLVRELVLEFFSTLRFVEVLLDLDAPDTIHFQVGGAKRRLSRRQFILALGLHTREEMESPGFARSGVETLPLDDGTQYCWEEYLRLFATGRKSGAHVSGRQFVTRLTGHFGLLTAKILGGLTVAMGPKRKPDAAPGAPTVAEDAPAADEGDQAILAPVQAPQQPSPSLPAAARTMPQRLGRLEEELMDASGLTYQAFDGTYQESSPAAFQRCIRQRTGEASTSTAQQDP
ncbi:hypothetical protein Tco_0211769 [Tanacetum coccineum]